MLPYVAGAGTHRRTGGRCSLRVRRSVALRYFAAAQFAAAKSQLASLSKNVCV